MASNTKGYTFGATEQVTNTKLHTLVDSSTIDLTVAVALGTTTPSLGAFTSTTATAICLAQTAISASGTGTTPFLCTRFFSLDINGTTLYIPCASATA